MVVFKWQKKILWQTFLVTMGNWETMASELCAEVNRFCSADEDRYYWTFYACLLETLSCCFLGNGFAFCVLPILQADVLSAKWKMTVILNRPCVGWHFYFFRTALPEVVWAEAQALRAYQCVYLSCNYFLYSCAGAKGSGGFVAPLE